MSLNWSQLMQDAGNPAELIPDSDYAAVIDSCLHKQSKNGKDMYVAKWKLVSGPYAGKTLYHNLVISPESPNAMQMFFKQMNTLGLDAAFFGMNPTHEQVATNLIGRQAVISVGHKTWNNEARNEVTGISRGAAGPQVPGVPVPPQAFAAAQSTQTFVPQPVLAPPAPQPALTPVASVLAPPAPAPYVIEQPIAAPPIFAPPAAPAAAPPAPPYAPPAAPAYTPDPEAYAAAHTPVPGSQEPAAVGAPAVPF